MLKAPSFRRKRDAAKPPGLLTQAALMALLGGAMLLDRRLALAPKSPELLHDHKSGRSPTHLSWKGWRTVFIDAAKACGRDQIFGAAGGVAYFVLLALFPGAAAAVSLYGLFANVNDAHQTVLSLAGVVPREALQLIATEIFKIAVARPDQLSVAFVVSIAVSVWSANAGVKAMIAALNTAYETKETRGFIRQTLLSLAFTVAGVAAATLGLALLTAARPVLAAALPGAAVDLIVWAALVVGLLLGLAGLYRYGPNRGPVRWRWVTPGSVMAAVVWLLTALVFSAYVARFGSYNKTYGSLGAAAGLMTWLWLSCAVVLFGAELNTEIERHTKGLGPDA